MICPACQTDSTVTVLALVADSLSTEGRFGWRQVSGAEGLSMRRALTRMAPAPSRTEAER
jgi:hypothetical protein